MAAASAGPLAVRLQPASGGLVPSSAPRLGLAEDVVVPSLDSRVGGIDVDVDAGAVIVGRVHGFGQRTYRVA
ncbi:hypothetical protein GCM10023340_01640 [Nocardioides marinquilinus]|uniref:Uncharacterized protein n=1 Tax=Nocardioides marinquilinus TaxID=1210400 RepID=A0ABP9P6Q7_9ACTN